MGVLLRIVAWMMFAIAVVMTGLGLVPVDYATARQVVGFVILTFPLFLVAFLLFGVQVVFPGKSRWQITMALAAVALAGLVYQGWQLAPRFTGSHPEPGTAAADLRVLTLNLDLGTADPNDVVSAAVTSSADVLVFQEVEPATLTLMEQAGLDTAFPHRAGLPMQGGQYGTMVFSSAPLGDVTFLGSHQSSVQLRASLPGGQVWIVGVGVPPPDNQKPDAWKADLGQLQELAGTLRPAIVAGDFEASFEHQAFRDLLDAGLRDVGERANAGWQPTWPTGRTFYGIPVPRLSQPDHVLIGSAFAAVSQRTVEVPGTDHLGVLAAFGFR